MKNVSIWLRSAFILLTTLAVIAGLAWFKYAEIQAQMNTAPPPEVASSVLTANVETASFRPSTTVIGNVLAPRSIVLSNEMSGTVAGIHFEPGQRVEEGQILVELDTDVLEAQLESAKARLQKAEATNRRFSTASRVSAVTPDELDQATAELAQAAAQVKELEATISRMRLRAPFAAQVGLSDTHVGQFLPSGTEIVTLQSLDDFLFVDFMIPQSAIDSTKVGQEVQLMIQGETVPGRVIALDAQANRSSRNLMGRIEVPRKLPSGDELALPGESLEVRLEYGVERDVLLIPAEALLRLPDETFVYVVEQDDQGGLRARKTMVIAGQSAGEKVTIFSGLEVGDQVVTDGAFKLRDGDLIDDGRNAQPEHSQ